MIWLVICGIIAGLLAFMCYACIVVGSRYDRRDDDEID